jgi:subtilisin family serine protease
VDSGIDASHPDLRGKIAAQRDLAAGDGRAEDRVGHGTAVAGVIAAKVDNRTGIAGACPECELLVAKDGDEFPELGATARGIHWATRHGATVVPTSRPRHVGVGSATMSRNKTPVRTLVQRVPAPADPAPVFVASLTMSAQTSKTSPTSRLTGYRPQFNSG